VWHGGPTLMAAAVLAVKMVTYWKVRWHYTAGLWAFSLNWRCVCTGLDRSAFDNKSVSFEEHCKLEHNMWHYLFFIILLKVKLPTEFTGPESYVYSMIQVALCIRLSIISCSCSIVPLYLACLWRRLTYSHSEWAGNCKHHSCVLRLIKNVVMLLVFMCQD